MARKFARRNPRVTTSAVGKCKRRTEQRVDCLATDRGSTNTSKTVCHLRIAVRGEDGRPDAAIASARCRTIQILRLTAARARAELRAKAAELAAKPVGIINLERSGPTSFRGFAEWTRPGGATQQESCFALMEAVLRPSRRVDVTVIEMACEPALTQ
jgi:hypothetical protein